MRIIDVTEYSTKNVAFLSEVARQLTDMCPRGERLILSPAEVRMMLFRGTPFWLGYVEDLPVTLNATKFGTRKKNIWEPYANWYIAYTRPACRRRGYARELATHVRNLAVEHGCVRLKALAGSRLGYQLHRGMGDQFWAMTPRNELVVDTPLVTTLTFPNDKTPASARQYTERTSPLLDYEVASLLKYGLRFDAEKQL